MDMAWIQVFILTMSECVAPAGKTVCQERELELRFLNQADCEAAMHQLVALKQESERVIVDPKEAGCVASARQSKVFSSPDAAKEAYGNEQNWRPPDVDDAEPGAERSAHEERLARLPACDDAGVAPCKIGDIILEGTGDPVEVWRRDQ